MVDGGNSRSRPQLPESPIDDDRDGKVKQAPPSEAEVIEWFSKMAYVMTDRELKTSGAKGDDFKAEARLLSDCRPRGLRYGLAAATISFLAIRKIPPALARVLYNRSLSKTNRPTYAPPGVQSKPPFFFQQPAPGMTYISPRQGPLLYVLRLTFDTFLSVWIGVSVAVYKTDAKKLMDGLSRVPLVEGRSIASEGLCKEYVEAYSEVTSRGFDWESAKSNKLLFSSLSSFVQNCKKRMKYEDTLRKRMGLSSNDPVAVPSPGVPEDFDGDVVFDESDGFNSGFNTSDDFDRGTSSSFGDTESFEDERDSNNANERRW